MGKLTLEFRYGICLSLFSPFSPKAATTSPRALKLLLMLCVSFSLSLSVTLPAVPNPDPKLTLILSLPARSTKFKHPSHVSPVLVFVPLIRKVNTECERDDRSFIRVAATDLRDWAVKRRDRTWLGDCRGTTVKSVTRVEPDLKSCLMSCFFLSKSPFPRRSLMASLYCIYMLEMTTALLHEYSQSPGTAPLSYIPIPWTGGLLKHEILSLLLVESYPESPRSIEQTSDMPGDGQ